MSEFVGCFLSETISVAKHVATESGKVFAKSYDPPFSSDR